ncbi:MAG: hypothetical protein JOY79_01670 [Acidobacteriaceae bacterium]|nr:hypothetical protein [Acidobacteriaceae bacterium]
MRVILLSLILALIPLAGIAYIVVFGSILTVDGLFMSLILLAIAGIFLLNVLLELKARREPKPAAATKGTAAPTAQRASVAAPTMAASPSAGQIRREAGTVVKVDYYEAPVGQPNRSMVTFQPTAAASPQVIMLQGDVRNALPPGKRVRISYEATPEGNRLVGVE